MEFLSLWNVWLAGSKGRETEISVNFFFLSSSHFWHGEKNNGYTPSGRLCMETLSRRTHTHTRLLMRKRIHSRPPALSLSRVHFSKSAKWPSGNLLLLLDCCCWMVWLRVCCKWDPVIDDDGERRYSTGSDEDETRKHHRRKEGGWKQELLS